MPFPLIWTGVAGHPLGEHSKQENLCTMMNHQRRDNKSIKCPLTSNQTTSTLPKRTVGCTLKSTILTKHNQTTTQMSQPASNLSTTLTIRPSYHLTRSQWKWASTQCQHLHLHSTLPTSTRISNLSEGTPNATPNHQHHPQYFILRQCTATSHHGISHNTQTLMMKYIFLDSIITLKGNKRNLHTKTNINYLTCNVNYRAMCFR